ncbi:MAG: hypothetical protein U0U66_12150 [Cytophagaceae bacterium]
MRLFILTFWVGIIYPNISIGQNLYTSTLSTGGLMVNPAYAYKSAIGGGVSYDQYTNNEYDPPSLTTPFDKNRIYNNVNHFYFSNPGNKRLSWGMYFINRNFKRNQYAYYHPQTPYYKYFYDSNVLLNNLDIGAAFAYPFYIQQDTNRKLVTSLSLGFTNGSDKYSYQYKDSTVYLSHFAQRMNQYAFSIMYVKDEISFVGLKGTYHYSQYGEFVLYFYAHMSHTFSKKEGKGNFSFTPSLLVNILKLYPNGAPDKKYGFREVDYYYNGNVLITVNADFRFKKFLWGINYFESITQYMGFMFGYQNKNSKIVLNTNLYSDEYLCASLSFKYNLLKK